MQHLDRLPRESARDYAVRVLKYNIVHAHLAPGTMISVPGVAEPLGISRTPAREAMQELESTGILEIFPQAGSRISYLSYDKIHESRFIRLALELAVIDSVCGKLAREDIMALEELLRLQEHYLEQHNKTMLLEVDNQFHRQLYKASGKMMTYRLMESMQGHFDRVRYLNLASHDDARVVSDHRELLDALVQCDKKKAKRVLTRHLSRYKNDEKLIREKYPQYFAD